MSNRWEMESYLCEHYPYKAWKRKVKRMSYAQVVAIYLRLKSTAGAKVLKQINKTPTRPKLTTYHCNICDMTYERDNPDLRECDYCGLPFEEEEDGKQ